MLAAADTGAGQPDNGQFERIRPVDYVFGAAMFIRQSLIEHIGLFDERYFLFFEENDLCIGPETNMPQWDGTSTDYKLAVSVLLDME